MEKIMHIEGAFEQNGKTSPNNNFKGYIEVEDDTFIYQDEAVGEVEITHFKGIQVDGYDKAAKPRLVLGSFQKLVDQAKETINFRKLTTNPDMMPVVYGLEKDVTGFWEGTWEPIGFTELGDEERATLTRLEEIDTKEVKNVRATLDDGYDKFYSKQLPPQMAAVLDEYEQIKEIIKDQCPQKRKSKLGPTINNTAKHDQIKENQTEANNVLDDDELPF
jgi:hypothetical protein